MTNNSTTEESSVLQPDTPRTDAFYPSDADYWEEEAKRYCSNSQYWRERAEKAEAEVERLKGLLESTQSLRDSYRTLACSRISEVRKLKAEVERLKGIIKAQELLTDHQSDLKMQWHAEVGRNAQDTAFTKD
jgi:hypothetical protein